MLFQLEINDMLKIPPKSLKTHWWFDDSNSKKSTKLCKNRQLCQRILTKFFNDLQTYDSIFLFLNLVCVYNSCLKTRTCFLLNILHLAWNNTIQHIRSQFLRPELSMAKLWQGSGGGLHPLVEAYTVPGRDGPWGWVDFCRISGWFLFRAFATKSVTSNMVGTRVALCRISALKITRPTRPSYWKWEVLFSIFLYM